MSKKSLYGHLKAIPHGFSWFNVSCFVLVILICLGVHYGLIIAPQIRQTANQVANLNDLKKMDFHTDIKCNIHIIAGTINCTIDGKGTL